MSASIAQGSVAPRLSGGDVPFNKHRRFKQQSVGDWVVDIVIGLLVVVIVFAIIYPLWFIIIASFSDQTLVSTGKVFAVPLGFQIGGYLKIFADTRIWLGYWNTIVYTVLGTALNMVVTMPTAFALSRREFKPRRVLMFFFTFTMFFAGGIIPNYLLYKQLHLLNTMWVFIIPCAVNVFNLIIARSFFETSIPEELHDAAQIDGLSYGGYFMKVVLPLSAAIIAVIGLYYFVQHWNDYMTGLIYVRDASKQPLQLVLQNILISNQTQAGGAGTGGASIAVQQQLADQIKYGVIIVSTLPLLVLYPSCRSTSTRG